MELSFANGVLVLLLVAAILSRRLAFPCSVGLVATSTVLALLHLTPKVTLTRD